MGRPVILSTNNDRLCNDSLESINYERDKPLVKKILSGLGFLASDFDKKVSCFRSFLLFYKHPHLHLGIQSPMASPLPSLLP